MTTVSYTDAAIADAAVLQSALKEARPDGATFDSGAAVEAVTSSLPALKNDKIKSLVEGAERFKSGRDDTGEYPTITPRS